MCFENISKFRNFKIETLHLFAARFDFEIIDVFEIITPLYTPTQGSGRFVNFEGISKYWFSFTLSSGLSPRCDPLTLIPLCDHKRDWHLIYKVYG